MNTVKKQVSNSCYWASRQGVNLINICVCAKDEKNLLANRKQIWQMAYKIGKWHTV